MLALAAASPIVVAMGLFLARTKATTMAAAFTVRYRVVMLLEPLE